jgi:hypothetical protein
MPRVFISYRRQDSAGHTGRLRDRLVAEFGADQVFLDVEAIDAGSDFVAQINSEVGRCDALIAVIGDEWLETDAEGRRRLDDPEDFVRLEIAAGLARDVEVIPALVAGAAPPTADQLPDDLRDLASRQALELSDSRWEYDVGRLIARLRELGVGGAPARLAGLRGRGRALAAGAAVAVAAIGAAALVFGGGEGDDRGGDGMTGGEAPQAKAEADATMIIDPAGERQSMPEEFAFSVNQDLVGSDLQWRDWGEQSAAASGDFLVRAYPSTQQVDVPGTMLVTRLVHCRGTGYYTHADVSLPADIPFDPPDEFELQTPCD